MPDADAAYIYFLAPADRGDDLRPTSRDDGGPCGLEMRYNEKC